MKYTEPYLTYEQQAQRLLDAGLLAEKTDLIQRLRDVGYYRLSAYMAPYRVYDETGMMTERFSPGALKAVRRRGSKGFEFAELCPRLCYVIGGARRPAAAKPR